MHSLIASVSVLRAPTPKQLAVSQLTAFYPELMCEKIARALYPARVCQQVPCCPVVPLSSEQPSHREKEQDLKHVSPLAGEAFAVAVEADESAIDITKEVTEIMDLNGIMCDILGLPKEQPCAEVHTAVTKLLSRAEMLSSPEALQAVKAEADGLVSKGTWDLSSVREQDEVRSEAKSSGTSVHFGQLMTIASIKFHELAKHLQKVKGRIVYLGDAAKGELGYAAVYQELGANPTSVQGLNATLAYGSIPGHALSAADAVKAYVQASLKSRVHKTWIQLPPELRPSWWREKFAKPVVLLVKALYGHPEAGGHWERHLKGIISRLGGDRRTSSFNRHASCCPLMWMTLPWLDLRSPIRRSGMLCVVWLMLNLQSQCIASWAGITFSPSSPNLQWPMR